ncbi:hypothetical protein AB3S75_000142 [Citrus x aurantiifolia]
MAKINKVKKLKQATTSQKPNKKILKKEPKSLKKPEPPPVAAAAATSSSCSSSSESESEPESESISSLLEPYSKDQLIDLIAAAATKIPLLHDHILETADRDVSQRKIFVHGLGWDTTQESLLSAFGGSGEIEECKLVIDKVTGKAKGFAFIVFKTRKAAVKALKNPQRKVNNRLASCQLASVGPTGPGVKEQGAAAQGERKIYVSNVPRDVEKEKLRGFFERFGEIETGPIGFDITTGKSRGFAIFVYKTVEGARKTLEEPQKMFEGHQLQCQKAAEGKNRTSSNSSSSNNQAQMVIQKQQQPMLQGQQQGQGNEQEQVLAAMAAAQNLALFGQHPGMHPLYGGFLVNPGLINPMVAGALHQGAIPASNVGAMAGSSVLGSFGPGAAQGLQQQQHVYPNAPQSKSQGTGGGSFPGYTSYMWYGLLSLLDLLFVYIFVNFDLLHA